MPNQEQVALDENGFMRDPHQWSADVREAMAESFGSEGLGFAPVQVIEYLRQHYLAHGSVPPAEGVCHATRL